MKKRTDTTISLRCTIEERDEFRKWLNVLKAHHCIAGDNDNSNNIQYIIHAMYNYHMSFYDRDKDRVFDLLEDIDEN